ncbi:MAG: hypothetical protein GX776_07635, partial [Oxalobacter sp.]|nr:hypothetical protein [Oxalobacter sp.]
QPRAKGVRVQVAYPAGFESREDAEADEVRKFTRKSGELEEILILHVFPDVSEKRVKQAMPVPSALSQKERHSLWRKMLTGKNKWLRDIRDTKAHGWPGVFVAGTDITKKRGKPYYSQLEVLTVYDGKNMIMLSCTVTGPEERKAAVDRRYAKSSKTACQPFLKSLRFMENTGVNGPEVIERMDDEILQMDDGGPGPLCRRSIRR